MILLHLGQVFWHVIVLDLLLVVINDLILLVAIVVLLVVGELLTLRANGQCIFYLVTHHVVLEHHLLLRFVHE